MVKLEMTRDEARLLEMYLLMTTKYREEQVKTYRKLLEDWGKYGQTSEEALQALADNVQHWTEQCVAMDGIRKKVSHLLVSPSEA